MSTAKLHRLHESGSFEWPWDSPNGVLILRGAAGGGGGGGGSFVVEGLTLYGAGGGGGGDGGELTRVQMKQQTWDASGGNGGSGGGGGGIDQGNPVPGIHGWGCKHGDGGNGGQGGNIPSEEGQIASIGGNGGKGFPGETLIFELSGLSIGDLFEIVIGNGGKGGKGGQGYESGVDGSTGESGLVYFIPLFESEMGEA